MASRCLSDGALGDDTRRPLAMSLREVMGWDHLWPGFQELSLYPYSMRRGVVFFKTMQVQ